MQSSLMDQLHEQEFISFLTNVPLNVVQTHLCSCVGPTAGLGYQLVLTPLQFVCPPPIFSQHSVFISIYHILQLHNFHDVSVVTPSMIWRPISCVTHAKVNALQSMIRFEIPLQVSCQRMEFTYRERFPTFSPTIHGNEWILSSLEINLLI